MMPSCNAVVGSTTACYLSCLCRNQVLCRVTGEKTSRKRLLCAGQVQLFAAAAGQVSVCGHVHVAGNISPRGIFCEWRPERQMGGSLWPPNGRWQCRRSAFCIAFHHVRAGSDRGSSARDDRVELLFSTANLVEMRLIFKFFLDACESNHERSVRRATAVYHRLSLHNTRRLLLHAEDRLCDVITRALPPRDSPAVPCVRGVTRGAPCWAHIGKPPGASSDRLGSFATSLDRPSKPP